MRVLLRVLVALLAIAGVALLAIRARYGGGEEFPDLTGDPALPASALELVADLDWPPGNIAVSRSGRVFFTFHPEASPPVQVLELVDGEPVPYPPQGLPDGLAYQSVLSIRIDGQNRLWALDNAHHGSGDPRLLGFELASGRLVHRHDFPREIAGLGSHLNDFQVSPDGRRVYIAEASIFAKTPALVVYDVESGTSRRLLEGHPSVTAEPYIPTVQGRRMLVLGIFAVRPGVDSIALDRRGEWLHFAPVTNRHLYRVRRADLDDAALAPDELAARVEAWTEKTMSDGISTDDEGGVYLTNPDQSAILRVAPDGSLQTLLKDPRLRWPDGLSFGPDGWLYVTCSALHQVIMRSGSHMRTHAPYQIYRFRPGFSAPAGH